MGGRPAAGPACCLWAPSGVPPPFGAAFEAEEGKEKRHRIFIDKTTLKVRGISNPTMFMGGDSGQSTKAMALWQRIGCVKKKICIQNIAAIDIDLREKYKNKSSSAKREPY